MSSVPSSFVPVEISRRARLTLEKATAAHMSIDNAARQFKAAVFAPHDSNNRHAAMRAAAITLVNYFREERNRDKPNIIEKAHELAVRNGLPDDIINILSPPRTN